jgi:hypothetical protein
MPFKKVIAVYTENHVKSINSPKLFGMLDLLYVKVDGA